MKKRKQKEWTIEEWDETPASDPAKTDPFSPETLKQQTEDDWGDPLPSTPPKRNHRKTGIIIGAAAAALVLLAIAYFLYKPAPQTVLPTAAPMFTEASVTAAPVTPVPETEVPVTEVPVTEVPITEAPVTEVPVTRAPVTDPPPTATPVSSALYSSPWYDIGLRWYYQQLSDHEKQIFELIYDGITDFAPSISLSGISCSEEEMDRVLFVLRNDCPELFQQDGGVTFTTLGNTYQSVTPNYRLTRTEYQDCCNRIRTILQQLQASFPANADDYDREKAVYCWLIQNCEYLDSKDFTTAAADACLCHGRARCSGYASALSLLLRSVGIPCVEILSIPAESHEWNAVKINGNWYECDVTWDDASIDGYEFSLHEGENSFLCYLNLPRRLMSAHTPEKNGFNVPYSSILRDNYAYREGTYISDAVTDWTESVNKSLRMRYRSGQSRFIVMVDIASVSDPQIIADKITVPGSRWQFWWPQENETHTFYIEVTER